MVHFDAKLPLILATDASLVGLGAVLSHRYPDGTDRPITFASRTLSKSEKLYSQIDKEATAIYWGLKKFFQFCYGRKFILITDHKPLVTIFSPTKPLPAMTATRMFNYASFLSGFDYNIEYRRTGDHGNADFLSRFPLEEPNGVVEGPSIFNMKQIDHLPITHTIIATETKNDPQWSIILNTLKHGKSLNQYGLKDGEYSLENDCILKGCRVVIPVSLRRDILTELHVGHLGIVKMKILARSYCYWTNIDRDIEEMVGKCKRCCLKQKGPQKEVLHKWDDPSGPWNRLHVDFAGPFLGYYYFIIVDAGSKWVEVLPTKTTTTEWCIKQLRRQFTIFGLPFVLVSDNGPQFKSHKFEQFLLNNGIEHKTSAPYHPATNGQAERFVQTIKRNLGAMCEEPGDIDVKLNRLLMQLRKVQNSTGSSAYTLMFNRNVRTRIDLIRAPQPTTRPTRSHQAKRKFQEGDHVQIRDYSDNKLKWVFGVVKKKEGILHYTILLNNGTTCRRHVDQIRATKFRGED